jgi:tetratricopeptide (TPR) repeat protein
MRDRSVPPDPPMPSNVKDPDVVRAIESERQKVHDNPRSAAAWGDLGVILLAHQCYPEADRCLEEASRLAPDNGRWAYFRFIIAATIAPQKMLEFLRQAEKGSGSMSPEDRRAVRLRLAEALLERHELDEAEALFREEVRRKPNDPRANFGLGMIARLRNENNAATDLLTVACNHPAARKKTLTQLAALARIRGDLKAAEGFEKEVAALPSDNSWEDPFYHLLIQKQAGDVGRKRVTTRLERSGRPAEAADIYLERLRQDPTPEPLTYIAAGYNLARSGNFEDGLPLLRKGVQLDPDSANPHFRLAEALFLQADAEHRRHPDSTDARMWFADAAAEARRATELKKDHAFAYVIWGWSLLKRDEPGAAVEPLRKAVECRPEMFAAQLALGEALLNSATPDQPQRYQEAATYLENARALQPTNPQVLKALQSLRNRKGNN